MPKRQYDSDCESHSQPSLNKCNGSQIMERNVLSINHTKQPDFNKHQRLLQGVRLDDKKTDIKFVVDEEEIAAHKQVIEILKNKRQLVKEAVEKEQRAARQQNTEEATIFQMSGTTARAFRKLLDYIYTGKVNCNLSTGIELASTALKLKFHDLVASLAQQLYYNKQHSVSPQTVDEIYHIAKCAVNSSLLEFCGKYLDENAYDLKDRYVKRESKATTDPKKVLMYSLEKSRYINYIHFLIPDKYEICFNVLISADKTNWTVVLRNEFIECKFWNWVYFEEKRIKYIKIVVTDGLKDGQDVRCFKDENFLCKRANINLEFDKSSGLLIPKHDIIKFPIKDTKLHFGIESQFTYCTSHSSANNKIKNYYYHNIGDNKFMEFYLSQTCLIDSFKVWFWDRDNRTYDFKVLVKDDIQEEYDLIKDDNSIIFRERSSKQIIHLKGRRAVRWIRLEGIRGPPNDTEFAIIDFECPPQHNNSTKNKK